MKVILKNTLFRIPGIWGGRICKYKQMARGLNKISEGKSAFWRNNGFCELKLGITRNKDSGYMEKLRGKKEIE